MINIKIYAPIIPSLFKRRVGMRSEVAIPLELSLNLSLKKGETYCHQKT
jgi:hypothetical protein